MSDYSGYKWIKVVPYKMNPDKSWEERYHELEKHHIQETMFLIEEIRKVVDEAKRIKEYNLEKLCHQKTLE
jgi:hypothetical protein